MIRRPCSCTKQKQNVARVLYNNRDKFPKDVFYTNMAAMTSEVFAALNLVREGYVSIFFRTGFSVFVSGNAASLCIGYPFLAVL